MMNPMGVTLDETSTTFARLFGSLIISIPVLLFFARKSASSEFKRGVVYCIFTYLLVSTIILLITQLKGLMNPMGWSIVILHFVFMLWFGYYLIKPEKRDLV
jgi:tellurite resistance protein TehA-like permease